LNVHIDKEWTKWNSNGMDGNYNNQWRNQPKLLFTEYSSFLLGLWQYFLKICLKKYVKESDGVPVIKVSLKEPICFLKSVGLVLIKTQIDRKQFCNILPLNWYWMIWDEMQIEKQQKLSPTLFPVIFRGISFNNLT